MDKKIIVQNTGNFIQTDGVLSIIPGVNHLDKDLWQEFKKHPLHQSLIDNGVLEPLEDEEGNPNDITSLKQAQAVALIKDTFDLVLIESFIIDEQAGENRKGVIEALKKQFEAVKEELEESNPKKDAK